MNERRPSWGRKVTHRNLGECIININCLVMQVRNPDPTSIFVEHDGDIKEVSRSMISETIANLRNIRAFKKPVVSSR